MKSSITGGVTSIYVNSMDTSVEFYTQKLGLQLVNRIGDEWAVINAGKGFLIGLHPFNPQAGVQPGTTGAINIELQIPGSVDMEKYVQELKNLGIEIKGDIKTYEHVRLVSFLDPSNNEIILGQEK